MSTIKEGRREINTLSSDGGAATVDVETPPSTGESANSGSTWSSRSLPRVIGSSTLMRLPSCAEVSRRDRYSGYIA